MKRYLFISECLLFLGVMVGAVHATTITYSDKLGRPVTVSVPVKRAVFLISYELIPVLDVWTNVVGISRHAYQNDLMKATRPDIERSIPSAGSGIDINIEALLRLRPDVVITWAYKPEAIRFMEEKGLKVISIYPETLAELYEVMRLHGRLFKKEGRIEETIGRMEEIFRLVRERVSNIPVNQRRKVLWLGGRPTSIAGAIGLTNDIFMMIGGANPASSIPQRNVDVSLERIIGWDPDVIFIWGNARYQSSDILNNPQWRTIKAVKEKRVYKAPDWSTWSPRLAPVALWMAKKVYPERFQEVDPERVSDEFHKKVFGVPYARLNKFDE
ncbi:MAG: ABC transporter substrate-binding protein [Desulfobacterota bacterium]|nr:ABC transporter substrate-binding protein [Thermodesulfobacteriota bacterium]